MNRLGQDPPKCLALLPCQSASCDPNTKQWSILGTFTEMQIGDKFPVMVPEINVYVALGRGTGGDGHEAKDTVNLAILSPGGDVLGLCIVQVFWEGKAISDYGLLLRNVVFRTPGEYTLRMFVEGHILAERPISIKAVGTVK